MLEMGFLNDMETIIEATPASRQTLLFSATWPDGITGRALRNDFTARWHGREGELAGAGDGEMARYRAAAAQGDTDTAVIFTGEGADLIDDVPSAGEIVTRLVAEAEHALAAAARRVV